MSFNAYLNFIRKTSLNCWIEATVKRWTRMWSNKVATGSLGIGKNHFSPFSTIFSTALYCKVSNGVKVVAWEENGLHYIGKLKGGRTWLLLMFQSTEDIQVFPIFPIYKIKYLWFKITAHVVKILCFSYFISPAFLSLLKRVNMNSLSVCQVVKRFVN